MNFLDAEENIFIRVNVW